MSGGPDGPEQREAYAQERSWLEDEAIDMDEQLADESRLDPDTWGET